jgi:TolB-like protein/Flp pilus assembly protein TadD
LSFFNELKRRNVFRVTAAYLALSWVITQVTGAVVPALHLPDSIPAIVIWLGVIGFPFVILFSWVYEFTPEGLKRENEVDRAASITHLTSKRLDYIIIGLMVLAIGLFVADRFLPVGTPEGVNGLARDNRAQDALAQEEARDNHAQVAASDNRAQGRLLQEEVITTAEPAITADDKSIAVLPFVNMSSDKEQEYFSDGMSEELLNLLSQVPDLKVIARTSSFAFKGKDIKVEQIAKELNVAHVLEGSVRKSGNTVRITAQLVRTADSTHLWSETYDRPLDDIFKVQDEIANAIVQALQIRLAGGELSRRKGGTQNLEAYQLYLQGVSALSQNTRSSLDAADDFLEQATKLDPTFGLAWWKLADTVVVRTDNGFLDATEGYERVRQLALHAVQLSPNLAEAHIGLLYVHRSFDWDWAAAEAEGQRALVIDQMNSVALHGIGMLSFTLGRWDDAERQLRAALIRDPVNTWVILSLGISYYCAGRFTEAEGTFSKLFELAPGFYWTHAYLGKTLLAQGKPNAALAMVRQDGDESSRLMYLPVVLLAAGREAEADVALQAQVAQWADTGAYYVAVSYAYRGNHELALNWLERAYQQKDTALIEIVGEPLFKSMANDPRFKAFLHKMNLPTEPVPLNWQ